MSEVNYFLKTHNNIDPVNKIFSFLALNDMPQASSISVELVVHAGCDH